MRRTPSLVLSRDYAGAFAAPKALKSVRADPVQMEAFERVKILEE